MVKKTSNPIKIFAKNQAFLMIAWARNFFGFDENWQPYVVISTNKRRKFSYGGLYLINNQIKPGINIALGNIKDLKSKYQYLEYEPYETNYEIGSLYELNWKQYITAILCHELSHVVQYSVIENLNILPTNILKNFKARLCDNEHGEFFQHCLFFFRKEWLNNVAIS